MDSLTSLTQHLGGLLKAKEQLGKKGRDNVRIRAAVADLDKVRLDLKKTTIRAPSRGLITNLRIDEGHYANPGQPLMTFVAVHDVWIEAYLRENSLGNVKPGDRVEVALDIQPGRIFPAHVTVSSSWTPARPLNPDRLHLSQPSALGLHILTF